MNMRYTVLILLLLCAACQKDVDGTNDDNSLRNPLTPTTGNVVKLAAKVFPTYLVNGSSSTLVYAVNLYSSQPLTATYQMHVQWTDGSASFSQYFTMNANQTAVSAYAGIVAHTRDEVQTNIIGLSGQDSVHQFIY